MNDTITLLRARRSAPPAAMSGPGPTPQEIEILLALAARVPDHGKLAPWRFILFEGAGRERAGEIFAEIYAKANPGGDDRRVEAERNRFCLAPLVVGVEWEQILSAGAVCMNLMVAANALGFASIWLTDWVAYDRACAAWRRGERKSRWIHPYWTRGRSTRGSRPVAPCRYRDTILEPILTSRYR